MSEDISRASCQLFLLSRRLGRGGLTIGGFNRKNFFLGRAQIYPRQGINFSSGGGDCSCVRMIVRCQEISQPQKTKRDKRDRRDSEIGMEKGEVDFYLCIIYILFI